VGAVVVWTDLHPAMVQMHFVLSMVLVWAAVTMLVRSGEPDDGRRVAAVVPRIAPSSTPARGVVDASRVLVGTVVTGTGPHAGDEEAKRFFGEVDDINGRALVWVTRTHSVVVWITVAVALSLLWRLRKLSNDRKALDAPLTAWLVTAMVQGAVGYAQYAGGLPVGLVAMHLAGATTLTACTAWLWCSTSKVSASASEMLAATR
jgi:cytochrome c oxidase assembly protein subunit 15